MLRRGRFGRSLVLPVVTLAAVAAVFLLPLLRDNDPQRPAAGDPAPTATRTPAPPTVRTARASSSTEREPPRRKAEAPVTPNVAAPSPRAARPAAARPVGPRASIVIDDLGRSLSHLEQLAALGIPLSIAVIPGLPASAQTVDEASRRGIELLVHQPMEPREEGGKDPGPGVLLTSMSAGEIRAQVRASLDAVPGAVGVNNHMGSRFTEDAAGLEALLAEIGTRGLFWLDSRTTAATRGAEAALAAGVPAIERDVFLDAEVDADFIRGQVRKLLQIARQRGTAVGIGHPHPETIGVLRELRGELLDSGVTLVPVSALVRKTPGSGTALAAAVPLPGRGRAPVATREGRAP